MKCTICGHESRPGSMACPRCGGPLQVPAPTLDVDQKTVLRAKLAVATPGAEQQSAPPVGMPAFESPAVPRPASGAAHADPGPLAPVPVPPPPAAPPQAPAPTYIVQPPPAQNVVVLANRKSVAAALVLTFFFGPLGMFYSTVAGALIMLVVTILGALVTGGISLFLTGPVCMVWAAVAANQANDKLMRQVQGW